jgi:ATP:corrinoid adenosyltransferase
LAQEQMVTKPNPTQNPTASVSAANQTAPAESRHGFFILFGRPGVGKSTAALETFPDSLYIASSTNLDQFFNEWLKTPEGKASGKRPPKKVVVIDQYSINGSPIRFSTDKDGRRHMLKIPQRQTLEQAIEDVTLALSEDREAGRPPRYRNIILDELSVFWERMYLEIAEEMIYGLNGVVKNSDGRAHYGQLGSWSRQVIDRLRTVVSMGVNLIAVAHDTEPDGKKAGGPQLPSQRIMRIFAADAHGVLQREVEGGGLDLVTGKAEPVRPVWKVFATKEWTTKIRGISSARLDEIRDWTLEKIVTTAGFTP